MLLHKVEKSLFALPHPPLKPPLGGTPSKFLDETYPAKTRGMGLLYGENCMILTSNAFDWSTRVTDRRTDRQTELPWHIHAIAHMLSRVKSDMLNTTGCTKNCCSVAGSKHLEVSSAYLTIASRSQRVSLIVFPFCLSVCRSFHDLQPTTTDWSEPNSVGRYTHVPVLRLV